MKEDTAIRSADIDIGYFDLNTVDEKKLAEIPGIGPEAAHRIFESRPYEKIEDLAKVPGITQDHIDELVRAGATLGEAIRSHPEEERTFET